MTRREELDELLKKAKQLVSEVGKVKTLKEQYESDIEILQKRKEELIQEAESNVSHIAEARDQADTKLGEVQNLQGQANQTVGEVSTLKISMEKSIQEAGKNVKHIGEVKGQVDEELEKTRHLHTEIESIRNRIAEQLIEAKKDVEDIQIEKQKNLATGLSKNYTETMKRYNKDITLFTWAFIVFSVLLAVGGGWFVYGAMKDVDSKATGWDIVRTLSLRSWFVLVVFLPVVWLLRFLSRSSSENKRLQEEYNHKANISRLYQNIREEIGKSSIDEENKNQLNSKMMEAILEAASHNPSKTVVTKQDRKWVSYKRFLPWRKKELRNKNSAIAEANSEQRSESQDGDDG